MNRWHTFAGGVVAGMGVSVFALGVFHLAVAGFLLLAGAAGGAVGRGALSRRGRDDKSKLKPPA